MSMQGPQRPEENIGFPGIAVTDGCEMDVWLLGIEPGYSGGVASALNH